ncbi:uncharacterized protein LOC130628820 [Hydractinia symbiolongicarpus]|uniref:uncharacterized protein LOC130628820 n=1 Tax=Hydractinia symbiolongicarpus TaxID=13093 RepID=UPI0025504F74|nr:uncharacterized protein LOC130628820 [Hydractinia symbiolongicarpus]
MATKVAMSLFLTFLLCNLSLVFTEPTMKIEVLKEPPKNCVRKAAPGDMISMHYRGTLTSGKEFDSSYSRNQPFDFQLGQGMVIQGWEQGVPGMCVGEKRKLTIPPSLAYGDTGFGDIIPAKSTLVFEIELINIKGQEQKEQAEEEPSDNDDEDPGHEHEHEHADSFESLDTNGDKVISSDEMANYIKKFHEGNEGEGEDENSVETIVSEIFQEDDKNKDGVISLEEYQHSAAALDDGDDREDVEEQEEEEIKEEL